MFDPDSAFASRAVITASVAFLIWVMTRIYELARELRLRRSDKRNYITALYAEIDFNTRDMEIFLAASSSIEDAVAQFHADPQFVPHITDARHTDIYARTLTSITHVGKDQIGRIVQFYGLLEKLKAQVDGLHLESFAKISAEGKEGTLRGIFATVGECASLGEQILAGLEDRYGKVGLTRNPR